jgi:hypothetical protein
MAGLNTPSKLRALLLLDWENSPLERADCPQDVPGAEYGAMAKHLHDFAECAPAAGRPPAPPHPRLCCAAVRALTSWFLPGSARF